MKRKKKIYPTAPLHQEGDYGDYDEPEPPYPQMVNSGGLYLGVLSSLAESDAKHIQVTPTGYLHLTPANFDHITFKLTPNIWHILKKCREDTYIEWIKAHSGAYPVPALTIGMPDTACKDAIADSLMAIDAEMDIGYDPDNEYGEFLTLLTADSHGELLELEPEGKSLIISLRDSLKPSKIDPQDEWEDTFGGQDSKFHSLRDKLQPTGEGEMFIVWGSEKRWGHQFIGRI